jgi:hypothetical protein
MKKLLFLVIMLASFSFTYAQTGNPKYLAAYNQVINPG